MYISNMTLMLHCSMLNIHLNCWGKYCNITLFKWYLYSPPHSFVLHRLVWPFLVVTLCLPQCWPICAKDKGMPVCCSRQDSQFTLFRNYTFILAHLGNLQKRFGWEMNVLLTDWQICYLWRIACLCPALWKES